MSDVAPVPKSYTTVTPYLVVPDAVALLDFIVRAFGAVEIRRSALPDGSAVNIEARIGDAMVMIAQGRPGHDLRPSALYVYVPDVDAAYARAMAAGGTSLMLPADQFYGDRGAGVADPAGNSWWLATRIEDLSSEELAGRIAERQVGAGGARH